MLLSESDRKALGLEKNLKSSRRVSKTLLQVLSSTFLPTRQARITADLPQPPFPHLLQSNTPPTEIEISLLRDIITIAQEEESRLKEMASNHTESDRLTSKIVRNLSCELGRAHHFVVQHNSILSSIRRIPPEILENIFIHTLPTTEIPGSRVPYVSQLPWALSQVCQLWRSIMLSFSAIWRDLPIVDLLEAHTKEKPYLNLLTELLKRSHNMPIRLTIARGSDEDIGHPAIDMLVLHSDRWQEVKINGSFGLLYALQQIRGRLSSLQSVYIDFAPYSLPTTDPVNFSVHDLFQIAPQLRYVDFHGPPCELLFPAHQLVYYSRDRMYFEQAIQVMVSSPSLRNLQFHVRGFTTENTLPALRLPDLIVLDASFPMFSLTWEPFFNNITTPALEELFVRNDAVNSIMPICSMILRSGSPCLLKVLHLHVCFAPGELQSILSLTPLVTKLMIAFPPTRDISALVFDGCTPPLVPLLKECEFLIRNDGHQDFRLSTKILKALNLLASSRCELSDNTTSAGTLLSSECHPLQTLRVSLGWNSTAYRQRFEGWFYSDMSSELYKLHGRLLAMLPELGRNYTPSNRTFDLKWQSEVIGLLTHLETLKIEKASDICVSGIQYILYAISNWFEKGDVRFSFSLIAKRILEKWEPILRDNMPNVRWHSTFYSFKYLSTTQHRALCSSPDAIKFFYYGLDSNDISSDHYVALYGMISEGLGIYST